MQTKPQVQAKRQPVKPVYARFESLRKTRDLTTLFSSEAA
jgi:hypothetical protein